MKQVICFLFLSLSVQAGCMFSKCRRPSVIAPEQIVIQITPPQEVKSTRPYAGHPQVYPASLRRERMRRRVRFAMVQQFVREKQAETQTSKP